MKNKEIEELLNELKDKYSYEPYDTTGKVYTTISYEEGQLLLSYIETLKKRNKELYEGFMATQEELTDYATKNEQLEADYKEANESIIWWTNRFNAVERDKKQLENNRDKAIEYNEHLIEHAKYHLNLGHLKKMRKILKGDSDE